MTRAEIQEKIRYHENLANQFREQVNSLQRKISDLESQVSHINSRKAEYVSDANKLKEQIGELNQLKIKFQTLQTNFANCQAKRVNKFNANFSQQLNVKFMSSYVDGMKSLLSGNDYKKAYNGLSAAREVIIGKTDALQNQADNLQKMAADAQKEINSKQYSISTYRSQKNTANNNQAYHKQRVTYWKSQLQYAAN